MFGGLWSLPGQYLTRWPVSLLALFTGAWIRGYTEKHGWLKCSSIEKGHASVGDDSWKLHPWSSPAQYMVSSAKESFLPAVVLRACESCSFFMFLGLVSISNALSLHSLFNLVLVAFPSLMIVLSPSMRECFILEETTMQDSMTSLGSCIFSVLSPAMFSESWRGWQDTFLFSYMCGPSPDHCATAIVIYPQDTDWLWISAVNTVYRRKRKRKGQWWQWW